MNKKDVIAETEKMIKEKLNGEGSGHDWWHVLRVWKLAKRIGEEEKADTFIVQMGALLHDVADWKSNDGDLEAGGRVSREWLLEVGVDKDTTEVIVDIVNNVSFKGAGVEDKMKSIEGKAVQDADRLDAMGAMGVGRVFTYGGHKGRAMYDPEETARPAGDFEAYKAAGQTSINHFYEKLLLLKDRMNTETGRKLAEGRHKFMEEFLNEFYAEWNGEK
jgi:uncharacterized protein